MSCHKLFDAEKGTFPRRRKDIMGMMRWSAFHGRHPRSFMIFADLDGRSQNSFELLNSVAEAMALGGNYALHPEQGLIRLAFECEADAQKFADSVQAHRSAREGGWSGQWAFRLNTPAVAAIRALLPKADRKSSGTRSGQRLNKRAIPF
jgi:hypothetical protein